MTISRASQTLTYPASFLLIAACNPCPCGYRNDEIKCCICTPGQADRYWSRLSGPILDRIDIHVEVRRLSEKDLVGDNPSESSSDIRKRVMKAVNRQMSRNVIETPQGLSFMYNGQIPNRLLPRFCPIDETSRGHLARAVGQYGLSARVYDRLIRMARTIADLDGCDDISYFHVLEAVKLRTETMHLAHANENVPPPISKATAVVSTTL